mmetsp:Transcript_70131/g.111308  ORF Transcript_70131/g.111308 Transcript_70131/m.111308 type:complete len:263 (-) Transcript_70131:79-867(-)
MLEKNMTIAEPWNSWSKTLQISLTTMSKLLDVRGTTIFPKLTIWTNQLKTQWCHSNHMRHVLWKRIVIEFPSSVESDNFLTSKVGARNTSNGRGICLLCPMLLTICVSQGYPSIWCNDSSSDAFCCMHDLSHMHQCTWRQLSNSLTSIPVDAFCDESLFHDLVHAKSVSGQFCDADCQNLERSWHSGLRVNAKRSSKQKDVRLWTVNLIMLPSTRLDNPKSAPLFFRQQALHLSILRSNHPLSNNFRQMHMAVIIDVIRILV